jgi:hypothetical protein
MVSNDDDSGLLGWDVSWVSLMVVALDRDEEGGEVALADDLPELPFGFEHAGGGPAERHLPRARAGS